MIAAMMNISGRSHNHEQIEKQTKKQSVGAAPKNKSRNTEIQQELKYFVDKATG